MKKSREQLIEEYLKEPIKAGDTVYVRGLGIQDKNRWGNTTEVAKIGENDSIFIQEYGSLKEVTKEDWKKYTGYIGNNPFPKRRDMVSNINFQLSSIVHQLDIIPREKENYTEQGVEIKRCNWNPYVYDKEGNKQYYQRDFVWSEDDKRTLIDSIYNNIDCGKILVRKRSWNEISKQVKNGETEVAFLDIVDGKQRLKAIKDFLEDKFQDSYGNYFSDLSDIAQRRLLEHQLFSYSELPENCPDEIVIQQFLKLNFCGVAQSQSHVSYVKSLFDKM